MLRIYDKPHPDNVCSLSGNTDHMVKFCFDGRRGGKIKKTFYVGNDSAKVVYHAPLVIYLVDNGTYVRNPVLPITAFSLKGNDIWTATNTWGADRGLIINSTDLVIPNNSTYLPFFLEITVPSYWSVNNQTNISIRIEGSEFFIGNEDYDTIIERISG